MTAVCRLVGYRGSPGRATLLAIALGVAVFFALAPAALAASPFPWSGPQSIGATAPLTNISCASPSLCAAGDSGGNIAGTSNPLGPWSLAHVGSRLAETGGSSTLCTDSTFYTHETTDDGFTTSTVPPASSATTCGASPPGGVTFPAATTGSVNSSGRGEVDLQGGTAVTEGLLTGSLNDPKVVLATGGGVDFFADVQSNLGGDAGYQLVATGSGGTTTFSPSAGGGTLTASGVTLALTATGADDLNEVCTFGGGSCTYTFKAGDVIGTSSFSITFAGTATSTLTAASCPTGSSMCAAGDSLGDLFTSSDPSGGAGAWAANVVDDNAITGLSCPTTSFCAAVDGDGSVLVSSNPATPSSWTSPPDAVDSGNKLDAVSCAPNASFCAAVDDVGNVITSASPAAVSSWTVSGSKIDPGHSLTGIACPSGSLCVAVDDSGSVFTSTTPSDDTSWSPSPIDAGNQFNGVSCPTTSFCAAVDNAGYVLTSATPTSALSWSSTKIDGSTPLKGVSCPSNSFCAAVDQLGKVLIGATEFKLTVTLAGHGAGSVSGGGISCPGTCTQTFVGGAQASLAATPHAGSRFSGWSGGGCSGTGSCSVTMTSNQQVTATFAKVLPHTKLRHAKISAKRHQAKFSFSGTNATGFQCALVKAASAKGGKKKHKHQKPSFKSCRSPKTYKHLKAGHYTFYVRAVNAAGRDPHPAKHTFTIP